MLQKSRHSAVHIEFWLVHDSFEHLPYKFRLKQILICCADFDRQAWYEALLDFHTNSGNQSLGEEEELIPKLVANLILPLAMHAVQVSSSAFKIGTILSDKMQDATLMTMCSNSADTAHLRVASVLC